MRDLKFRFWNSTKKSFVEGWEEDDFYIHGCSGNVYERSLEELYDGEDETLYYSLVEVVDLLIPQQYTGLKDKDGKEIYEGDIVSLRNWTNFVVKFGEYDNGEMYEDALSGVGFYLETNKGHITELSFYVNTEQVSIIGNIYEHPHLLANDENPELLGGSNETD